MSAAKQQWLVFSADQHAFATHTGDIVEIVPITNLNTEQEAVPGVLGWVDVEGEMIPVLDLVEHLHHKQLSYEHHEIIVIQGKDQLVGLMAERILAVTQHGAENELEHCVAEKELLQDVHYLKPYSLAVMRQS